MNKQSFYDELKNLLKQDQRFVAEDGQVLKAKVHDAAMSMDSNLLKLLLENQITREHFFTKVEGNFVFDKTEFTWVLESKEFLQDSYTMYKNKIGLVDDQNDLISQKDDVSLVWPYKDCVLAGEQTKEEQKREEVFYNETLAPGEINRLLDPKVFTNAKRYTKNGSTEIQGIDHTDNLIIKGNNLIALNSLKERFSEKVKLIYIDPPFNTERDSFKYNDSFTRSSWLTFMKNRLEIAKDLLSNDGSILVHIDTNQSHYLKILLDSIFKEEFYKNEIVWHYQSGGRPENFFAKKHDVIFWYTKSNNYTFNRNEIGVKRGSTKKNNMKKNIDENGKIYFSVYSNGKEYKYYEDDSVPPDDVWQISHLQQQDPERTGFNTQKPELLMERIIKGFSNPNDIVLDFFMGTATTQAVSHKLNRQYIGVEQMNYINEISVPRLKKVIEGEQNGISKSVKWSGGGSFVYCELKELNQKYIDAIQSITTEDELTDIRKDLFNSGFISHLVDPSEINEGCNDYMQLSFEEKRKLLLELVDKNKLYVNYSDINDSDMQVSEKEREFTHSFYEKEVY